jgi:hypothetical protein
MESEDRRRCLPVRLKGSLSLVILLAAGCGPRQAALVVSYETKRPIPNATVFIGGRTIRTDARGEFALGQSEKPPTLLVKAAGFWPNQCPLPAGRTPRLELQPLAIRGLYLSYVALGQPEARSRAIQSLDGERLNTLVVDIKDRQGRMTFYNGAPSAGQIGAFGAVKFDDIQAFLKELHRKHVYIAGRVAVFRDPMLAKHNPDWAVRAGGKPNTYWVDPYRREVWTYNLTLIKEAAALGFDEIELDCLWFPAEGELRDAKYSRHDSPGNRAGTIVRFLAEASQTLAPFNVCLSLSPGTVPRWAGEASSPDLGPLSGATEYLGASVRNQRDCARLQAVSGAEPRQWRAYVECAAANSNDPPPSADLVKALVTSCRTAGLGGWILADPRGQYNLTQDFIHELVPDDR